MHVGEKVDKEKKEFAKNIFKEKKNYKYRLSETQVRRICQVFNVWDLDEDGKCWSELRPTGDRDEARNDIPNLLRSLGELLVENDLDDLVEIFDPTFQGQFDLSAFLKGMATYYRDKQTDEGFVKIPGSKGKLKTHWCSRSSHDMNEYIRDNFFLQFHDPVMQASAIEQGLMSKGDALSAGEMDALWSLRRLCGAKKGEVCFPRQDDGLINLDGMYETLIEGIDAAIEADTTPMNETPKTQYSSPVARSVQRYDGTSYHLKD